MKLLVAIFALILMPLLAFSSPNPIQKPYFYRLTKGAETHYILGTFHMVIQLQDFSDTVLSQLEKATTVVLETKYSEEFRNYMKISYDDLAKIQVPHTILSSDQEKLKQIGYPEALIPTAQDDNCFGLFYYPLIKKYPFYQLDADIYFKSKDAGKVLLALDTSEGLAAAAKQDTAPACSVHKLLSTLTTDQILAVSKNMVEIYRSGYMDTLPADITPSVIARNAAWLPQLLTAFQKGSSFVGVGADHLFGDSGILSLLAKQGYTVQRM